MTVKGNRYMPRSKRKPTSSAEVVNFQALSLEVGSLLGEVRAMHGELQKIAESSLPKLISRVIDRRTPTLSETILGNILDLQLELRRHLRSIEHKGVSPYAVKRGQDTSYTAERCFEIDEAAVKREAVTEVSVIPSNATKIVKKSKPGYKPPPGPSPEPPAVIPGARWGNLSTELL